MDHLPISAKACVLSCTFCFKKNNSVLISEAHGCSMVPSSWDLQAPHQLPDYNDQFGSKPLASTEPSRSHSPSISGPCWSPNKGIFAPVSSWLC